MTYETDFQKQIENAFLLYGASVAQDRAVPDVRDMLKPGLRQGLYAQYSNKLTHKDKFQKAQKSVAAAMTQSYVHGDVAMYDTFIRASRPWSYRYPVEDVQGNNGNPSSPDSHAAARYVEMKAGQIADYFFAGLKKNAIDADSWYWNYDDTEQIPSVFPSIGYWNIVNGCSGIAVALATSVPTFNLKEVNEALIKIIQNPNVNFNEIYCAPDFPCGGTITNGNIVKESLRVGKGESIRIQAKLEYIPDKNMIRATELPYGVFTNTIIDQLATLVNDNPDYGIEKVTDHTKKAADIYIYLTKGVNPKKMITKLYKDTSFENWYSINMVLLDQGRFPKIFGWREACDAYIAHIRQCKRNEIQFDLDKALARKNIVDGLIKAYSIIDEVVATIRSSENPTAASSNLISKFEFNEEQAKAILAMKLSSLTKLDIVKLNEERAQLLEKIEWLNHLLLDSTSLDAELIKILREVADKFGDERRTKILNLVEPNEEEEQEIVKEEDVGVLLFSNNIIRLVEKEKLQEGKRGRKGISLKPPKGANLVDTLYTTNLGSIAAFTVSGRMYNFTLSDLEYDKDYSIYELVELNDDDIILLTDMTSFSSYKTLTTISKNGYIKKSNTSEYKGRLKKGIVGVKLEDSDKIVNVFLSTSDEDKILIASNQGYYNYYPLKEIASTGRATKGVKAIKLNKDERVAGATIIRNSQEYVGLLTIDNNGNGKITSLEDYPETTRATKGNQVMALKNSSCATVQAIRKDTNKCFLSVDDKGLTLNIADIPVQGRLTNGVRLIDARNSINDIKIM